ncbi:hypothetical protein C8R45DRAFT_995277 [Mycena sanguinolenta]|nr:hypothetical protein C8R45DRAFT_995277 [Mycena sanguinolenta]
MILTRRAYKSISRWLPNEVICEVMQATQPSDQVVFCRTCKLFNALGVPVLYRAVNLTDYTSLDGFCSTILSNPSKLAELVRSFTVTCRRGNETQERIQVTVLRLSNCVKMLLKIESLKISLPHIHVLSQHAGQLLSGTFPSLSHCMLPAVGILSQPEAALASFLTRHPILKSLWIESSLAGSRPSTSAPIPLPNLERLRAPAKILSSIIATQLKEVRLSWGRLEPVDATFAALKPLARSDVPFICSVSCWGYGYNGIVDSVSTHLPHTKTLHIEIMNLDLFSEPHDMFASIPRLLSRFTNLAFLSFTNYTSAPHVFSGNGAEDQIRAFVDVCPTLQACGFDEDAWRKVDGVWERFPIDDFLVLAGICPWA